MHKGVSQAALLDIRAKHMASSRARTEAEDSTAVLQLLGVAKTLLGNVSACPTCSMPITFRRRDAA